LASVRVALDSLVRPSYVIRNRRELNGSGDYRGRNIELFLEAYIEVTRKSSSPSIWTPRARPSSYYQGPIPDALVPAAGNTPASTDSFGVPPRKNQGVWVDIYVPRDAPAGDYAGAVRIDQAPDPPLLLPVRLRVYDFALSDTTHLHNMFAAQQIDIAERHGVRLCSDEFYAIEREYYKAAHRHRMDLNFLQTLDSLDRRARGYYTGTWYTPAFLYDGPGAGVGNGTYGIGLYDQPHGGARSGFVPDAEAGWRNASDAWVSWFARFAPAAEIFRCLTDEPDTAQYPTIRERARWIHDNPGPGRTMRTFCTVKIDPRLFGAVDVWALTGVSGYPDPDGIPLGYTTAAVEARRDAGERIAIYNGTRPGFGALEVIDADPADARVIPWIAWRYGVDLYFLWAVNQYRDGGRRMNPWVDQFIARGEDLIWGAGTLVYPGQDKLYPACDRGVRGPIASIRMKNWRRGEQDFEYLWLARSLGMAHEADSIARAIVPAAFDLCPDGQNGPVPWALRAHAYEAARLSLAALLENAGRERGNHP
ncbi:MAG TPA: glycoside hydrolase domain-containing protein, partial [Bacteroidota bacterium]